MLVLRGTFNVGDLREGEVVDPFGRRSDLRGDPPVSSDQQSDAMTNEVGVALGYGKACGPKLRRTTFGPIGERIILTDVKIVRAGVVDRGEHFAPECCNYPSA